MRFSLSRQAAACLASTVLLALATSPSVAQEQLAFGRRRAEFFYAKCGCFRNAIPPDPNAAGPPLTETRVDYQDFASYLEVAYNNRVSGFVEIPVRLLNPERNNNTSGLADMNAGFKVAMIACEDTVFTFQFRTYIPTGDSDRGLGTDHVSLEPGLLLRQRL